VLVVGFVVVIGAFLTRTLSPGCPDPSGDQVGVDWIRHHGERWGVHRPGREVDVPAPQGSAYRGGALFALIFIFWGEPTVPFGHRMGHIAADRAKRQAAPAQPEAAHQV
jgi:hypothetical protein